MAGQRLPLAVVQARGAKHLTKAEIKERQEREIQPVPDDIIAPGYLTKKQSETFYKLSGQLEKLKIMGETDVDALARYITANDQYIHATKQLRKSGVKNDPQQFESWSRIQERYFKMVRAAANDLGLSISSRCKLVIPGTSKEEAPKANKFKQFEKESATN